LKARGALLLAEAASRAHKDVPPLLLATFRIFRPVDSFLGGCCMATLKRNRPMDTILIVEDDTFIREHIVMMVDSWGYGTLSADDVSSALVHLRGPQTIDAIVTDVRLKSAAQGGFELAQAAVLLRPAIKVLYASGSPISGPVAQLQVAGSHHIRKPFTEQDLRGAVQHLLADRP